MTGGEACELRLPHPAPAAASVPPSAADIADLNTLTDRVKVHGDRRRGLTAPGLAAHGMAVGSGSVSLTGRPAGYGGYRGVGMAQCPGRPGRRIAALSGQREPMDECPAQRQRNGQQQPHAQAPGEK
jgi:hypothetical protein